jgi:hypothetical protein
MDKVFSINSAADVVETSETYYDLFNGYFNLEDLLKDELDYVTVSSAIETIEDFLEQLRITGKLEEF